jgi:hypothetical protein
MVLCLELGGRAPRPDREPYTRKGMADKADKAKRAKPVKAKPKKEDKGVLASLSSTRPERIGTRRASAPKTFEQPAAAVTASKSAATKPKTAKPAPKKRPARATATRRKAAAPRTFEPTEAAESAAGAADERAAGVRAKAAPTPLAREPRPRPVREGAPGMGTIGDREQPSPEHGRPTGTELVTTAVQAAGELAQIGLTIGGRIIKRAVDRLPKP